MKLIDAFIPIFSELSTLDQKLEEDSSLDIEMLSDQLSQQIAHSKNTLLAEGFEIDDFDKALFALCALIDEKVMNSQWASRERWAKNTLQKQYFKSQTAGTVFFETLDQLNEFNEVEQNIREVYLYCLAFGFTGCYFDVGQRSRLDEIIHANFKLLNTQSELSLFCHKVPQKRQLLDDNLLFSQFKDEVWVWGPIAFVLISYLLFRSEYLTSLSQLINQL
ncbi:type VI secretion system protein ImpK [Pseudoalteromonas ulvae UL12]|uniref:Type IV / VI secretion system DotU domain-containing protein n=1 Tax=Pseudoalteromonas ulvae TaxID=107327 RepID=A0A244CSI4_PSEDV|nr:type IVB secretion system protein IcmH/DotU [Pseudoalteromonas ulvae]MBE0366078.1 type VI secretion system protein ImpK [Pseudoalteromonas ulvae UL12]OUL58199.1 hypothetical protein B1199_07545 [Pseudoalteromonas ulvae]